MENLVKFINSFLSYGILFLLMIALVVAACILGVTLRKRKDNKEPITTESK